MISFGGQHLSFKSSEEPTNERHKL